MIKIFAFTFMLIAHIGYVFFPKSDTMLIIGRLAFPLFAWGVVEGYKYTKNFKTYSLRILGVAILSQYPYSLLFHNHHLNVCFTLFLGLIMLKIYNSHSSLFLKLLLISFVFILSDIAALEYGMYGLALIWIMFRYNWSIKGLLLQILVTVAGTYFYNYNWFQLFALCSPLIIIFFRNYNFPVNKFVSYSFYPLHIVLIFTLTQCF